jgi:hypothetical protein
MSSVSVGDGGDRNVITSTSIDDDNDTILGQIFQQLVSSMITTNIAVSNIVEQILTDLADYKSLAHLVMYLQLNLRRSFYRNNENNKTKKEWLNALQVVFQGLAAHCDFKMLDSTVQAGIMKVRVKP